MAAFGKPVGGFRYGHATDEMRADTAQRIGEYLRPSVADDAQDEPEDDPEEGADDRDSGND